VGKVTDFDGVGRLFGIPKRGSQANGRLEDLESGNGESLGLELNIDVLSSNNRALKWNFQHLKRSRRLAISRGAGRNTLYWDSCIVHYVERHLKTFIGIENNKHSWKLDGAIRLITSL